MRKLLILTANPRNSERLRLDEEVRDIEEGLKLARYRDDFRIVRRSAVRPRDLQRAAIEEAPQMVHFSGHGEGEAGLYFEDSKGNTKRITGDALASLFSLIAQKKKTQIECVVLNGCYSSIQAEAIAQHVPYVVGMQQSVGDQAAIEFAVGFYDAVWSGESVELAFESGKVATKLNNSKNGGEPVLLLGKSASNSEKTDENKSIAPGKTKSHSQKGILLLSAIPQGMEDSRREREVSEIENAIVRASLAMLNGGEALPTFNRPSNEPGLKPDQISKVLSTVKPFVIDIYGVEESLASLLIEKDFESSSVMDLNTLIGEFFQITSNSTQCIILNGCYAKNQAREIVRHLEFVIGIGKELSQDIIIAFLNEFYYQIGIDVPIKQAYNAACNRIRRRGVDKSSLPILLNKEEEQQRRVIEKELFVLEGKIEKDPASASLRTEKGDLLEKSGDHERAALAYKRSLHIEEKNYKVWWKRGKALCEAGRYVEAQKSYENALLLKPDFSDEYVISKEYALILRLINKPEKSLALYKKSLWLEPNYRAANYERKKAYKNLYSKNKKMAGI